MNERENAVSPEERAERAREQLENAGALYRLHAAGEMDVDKARVGKELLQLQTDLLDLYDGLARRSAISGRNPA